MNEDKVHLTFETDKKTAHLLTELAHLYGKTQPELIEEICKDHIADAMSYIISQIPTEEKASLLREQQGGV